MSFRHVASRQRHGGAARHAYSLDGDRLTLEMSGTNPDGSPAPTRTVVYARAILEPLPPAHLAAGRSGIHQPLQREGSDRMAHGRSGRRLHRRSRRATARTAASGS
jgi:hypothetical protein